MIPSRKSSRRRDNDGSRWLNSYWEAQSGPAGVVDSGMAGLVLGAAYVLSGRNLWVCILAHGFIDTDGVVAVFLAWAS